MTQPSYAPIPIEDETRPVSRLGPAAPWRADRPAELFRTSPARRSATESSPAGRGAPGPDQGYALRLAERFADRLVLEAGERADDVLAAAVAVAMRRAALLGRAPVAPDLEVALGLFGYLAPAAPELVAARRRLVAGVGHDEWRRRELANAIDEGRLRAPVAEAAARPLDPAELA